jgi:hypothetical protein
MPAKKISLQPYHKALTKIRKELVVRKKGATPADVAVLNKQIKSIDQATKSLRGGCKAFDVG